MRIKQLRKLTKPVKLYQSFAVVVNCQFFKVAVSDDEG